ncbi:MAG: DUF805 domain-containing protein [Leucobacter sp.]
MSTPDPNQQPPQYAAPAYGAAPAYSAEPGPGEPFDGASNPDDLSRPLYGASFGQAVRRFFKNYVNFTGRASRSEFWWTALFTFIVGLVPGIMILIGMITTAASAASSATIDPVTGEVIMTQSAPTAATGFGVFLLVVGWILSVIIGLALLLPNLGLTWRRLHDANFAGPFYFLVFIPSVGSIILIVLTLMPSKPEGRRFVSSR